MLSVALLMPVSRLDCTVGLSQGCIGVGRSVRPGHRIEGQLIVSRGLSHGSPLTSSLVEKEVMVTLVRVSEILG